MNRIIICRFDEVEGIAAKQPLAAVLSIEHPGVVPGQSGYAPRLAGVHQEILTFWDTEDPTAFQRPGIGQVEKGMQFVVDYLSKGDVLVHCAAGKARSAGVALGAMALWSPDRDEKNLVEDLLKIRPQAAPNIIVVAHADKIAGRGGRLTQAVLDHPVVTAQRKTAYLARLNWAARDIGAPPPGKPPKP
jgi:predicted protein tyrosine phosphatase